MVNLECGLLKLYVLIVGAFTALRHVINTFLGFVLSVHFAGQMRKHDDECEHLRVEDCHCHYILLQHFIFIY
jgi:hypothetical protein